MKTVTVYIDMCPISMNAAWRHNSRSTYITKKYRDFKDYVQEMLRYEYGYNPAEGTHIGAAPFKARYYFMFKGKRKRDLSNYIKPLEDVLEGFLYNNDEQCYSLEAERTYDAGADGVEVTLTY